MTSNSYDGSELPVLLLAAFRTLIERTHAELAKQGHPEMRALYGVAFKAIGTEGTTAVELAKALGVTKQAAGKTIASLEAIGYVVRSDDQQDARRKTVQLTPLGIDCMNRSRQIFADLRQEWADQIGEKRMKQLEADLRILVPNALRLDVPGWFGQ